MQKRWLALLGALGGAVIAIAAYAAAPQVDQSVAIVDAATPARQATVAAASTAAAAADKGLVVAVSPNGGDPCANPTVAKSSVALNISSATTTALVAAVASQVVYVCGFNASLTGTAPSLRLQYGTGGTCGSGTTNLTGTYLPTSGSYITSEAKFKTAASNELCAVSAGTSPSIQGVLTYVQQ